MLLKAISNSCVPRCLAETIQVNDLQLYVSHKTVCSMKNNCHKRIRTICLHLQEAYKHVKPERERERETLVTSGERHGL